MLVTVMNKVVALRVVLVMELLLVMVDGDETDSGRGGDNTEC